MIKRYTVPEIIDLWSLKNKYDNWLLIEKLNCEAWNKLDLISNKDIEIINKNIQYNIENVIKLEEELLHDVVAFTRAINLDFNHKSNKWIHYGLTSTDLVDTGNAITFLKVNNIIEDKLQDLMDLVWNQAQIYKHSVIIGRTHGVHAEVTSFGFKLLNFFAELKRHNKRFNYARKSVETIKISGSVGNYNQTDPRIEKYIANKLKLNLPDISTQVLARDNHLFYFQVLNNLGLSLNRFAIEMRLLCQTEINEVAESFQDKQKGSSSMPHKKNPISLENICGMTRLLTGYCHTIENNVGLWHERDISHSSNERIIFQDATNTIVYCLDKITNVIKNLFINTEQMKYNLSLNKDRCYSQKILHLLLNKTDSSREEIYDFIQQISNISIQENKSFIDVLKSTKYIKYFSDEEIQNILNNNDYLKFINQIFKKVSDE